MKAVCAGKASVTKPKHGYRQDLDYDSPEFDFFPASDTLWDDMPTPKEWLIEDVVPTGLSVLYGARSSGKSFVALDWAFCVGTGTSWLGTHEVTRGSVAYIMAEGSPAYRTQAWKKEHGYVGETANVYFIERAVDCLKNKQLEALKYWIRHAEAHCTRHAGGIAGIGRSQRE
jgi:hypothetical protein